MLHVCSISNACCMPTSQPCLFIGEMSYVCPGVTSQLCSQPLSWNHQINPRIVQKCNNIFRADQNLCCLSQVPQKTVTDCFMWEAFCVLIRCHHSAGFSDDEGYRIVITALRKPCKAINIMDECWSLKPRNTCLCVLVASTNVSLRL